MIFGPLVSVITPVYNREKYLVRCIESILEQTYSNFEFIIIDDKSSDNTLEIIKNYHVNNIANQASINLKFNNGFNALINCNWVSPIKIREVIIVGKNKSIVYDDMSSDKIREYSHKDVDSKFSPAHMKDIYIPRIPNDESLYNARKHFLKCIKENLKPKTNIYESKKIMSWIL